LRSRYSRCFDERSARFLSEMLLLLEPALGTAAGTEVEAEADALELLTLAAASG